MTRTTRVLPAFAPHELESAVSEALTVLQAGGLVAFPTDTVYGVGALAFSPEAVARLYAVKGRAREKAIPVLLGSSDQMGLVAVDPSPEAARLAEHFWPGPLTIVLHRQASLPQAVSPTDTVGVRVPDHPVALALLTAAGPMAVTSANRSGRPSLGTAAQVLADLGGAIELILDGGRTPGGQPSTVVACLEEHPSLLRQGPISMDTVLAVLGRRRPTEG